MFTHLTPPTTHKRWEKTTKTITIIKNKNFINRKCKPGLFVFLLEVLRSSSTLGQE